MTDSVRESLWRVLGISMLKDMEKMYIIDVRYVYRYEVATCCMHTNCTYMYTFAVATNWLPTVWSWPICKQNT